MNFVTPPEYDIIEACRLGGSDIFSYMDARKFLLTDGPGKNRTDRFIAYLICLKIIPPTRSKWVVGFIKAIELYYDHANKYFDSRTADPLEIVPSKSEQVMRNDFPRTLTWFKDFAKELKIDLKKIPDAETRIGRIFAVLSREHKDMTYTQGYDRYAFAFLALGIAFCNNYNLSYDVAEALAYHLTSNVLSILPMASLLDKQAELADHFKKLDKIFMNYNRQQFNKVFLGGASLILFGVKWELVLFADNHPIDETFRIWDQIFGRLECYTDVITALTIAHISQVEIPDNCPNVIECVGHYDKWDTTKLIVTANELLAHERSMTQACCEYCCPKFTTLHGYVVSSSAF